MGNTTAVETILADQTEFTLPKNLLCAFTKLFQKVDMCLQLQSYEQSAFGYNLSCLLSSLDSRQAAVKQVCGDLLSSLVEICSTNVLCVQLHLSGMGRWQ